MTSAIIDDDRPYSDRFYPAQDISDLPRDLQFDDVILSIDYARHSEVKSLLPTVIRSAAERADNVGTDEFEDAVMDFLVEWSFVFIARFKPSGLFAAFLVIGPSQFARTVDPSLADIRVFRADDVTDTAYVGLVEASLELTRKLDVGYTDCIVSVAATSSNITDLLVNQLQFSAIAVVPQSVKIKGVENQLVDCSVLIRSIVPQDLLRPPRSLEQVLSMLAEGGFVDGPADDARYESSTLPQVPFLPRNYALPTVDNLVITIRNMRKDEDRLVYDMLTRTVASGEGIGLHDSPNLSVVRVHAFLLAPCVVFEDLSNGALLGCLIVRPSWSVRSALARCAGTTLVIDKPYQGRGIGREVTKLMHALVKELGYVAIVNDHFINNVRSRRIAASYSRATPLGVVPRAAYLVGKGWHGIEIVRLDVSDEPMFTQLIDENHSNSTADDTQLKAKL